MTDLNELGKPKEVKSFRVFSDEEVPISALAVTEDCSQIAVGCATGTVILFDVNLKSNRAPKERKLTKSDSRSVTGLHYLENPHDPLLYVITVEDISVYYMRRKNMPYVCCMLHVLFLFIDLINVSMDCVFFFFLFLFCDGDIWDFTAKIG